MIVDYYSAPSTDGGSQWRMSSYITRTTVLTAATVAAQLRPLSFIHLTACVSTFQAGVGLYWHGNITTHTHLQTCHVPKLVKSHIHLALHISGHIVRIFMHLHRHTEVFLWAGSPYSPFFQHSGPASGLIVCAGLWGTLWHWLMVGTFSEKMPHWPHSGTPITHTSSAQVFLDSPCGCVMFFFFLVCLSLFHCGHISTEGNYEDDGKQVELKAFV